MKKLFLSLAAAVMLAGSASADEGMWLLPLLQKMNSKAMSELGCRISADEIYSINHSSLKDAIVHFGGGCTGEMISGQGLLVTNHHCGYSYIQAMSSPEHNYLENGFWAMNRAEEIPAPGLSVTFLKSMTDVTGAMEKAYTKALKEHKNEENKEELAAKAMNQEAKRLEEQAVKANPNCKAVVTAFYNSNIYYLIVSKVYTDVRFVGAPPAASGKFGGDTDNWMWPRHTCDFSMFRVYADKDNEPAAYSADNVPFTPEKSLRISLKGVNDGDFTMVMGYPGRTGRFQTAAQLRHMLDVQDIRIAARTVRQNVMWEARMADPKVNLQYASKYASSSNGWKKWIGMKQAFSKLDIISREEEKEKAFTDWVTAKKKRTELYGGALARIEEAVAEAAEAEKSYILLSESVLKIELVSFAATFHNTMNRALSENSSDVEGALEKACKAVARLYKDYSEPLDRKEAEALINFYRENVKKGEQISLQDGNILTMDVAAFVEKLFSSSCFTSEKKMRESIKSPSDLMKDPAAQLFLSVGQKAQELYPTMVGASGKMAEAARAFTAGQLKWRADEPSYPDANSTMRLTYGTVKSYSPKDGVLYKHYTTLKGVMEKEDPGNYEFRVPARLKEIWETKDFGQYAAADGQMPACFLTNCDITGGNSGSPVLDADGCLIGLAFDGNWESMSSDVMFEPDLQRCICVDIRYVLLMVDKFGGAGWLLDEMTIVK